MELTDRSSHRGTGFSGSILPQSSRLSPPRPEPPSLSPGSLWPPTETHRCSSSWEVRTSPGAHCPGESPSPPRAGMTGSSTTGWPWTPSTSPGPRSASASTRSRDSSASVTRPSPGCWPAAGGRWFRPRSSSPTSSRWPHSASAEAYWPGTAAATRCGASSWPDTGATCGAPAETSPRSPRRHSWYSACTATGGTGRGSPRRCFWARCCPRRRPSTWSWSLPPRGSSDG